MSRLGKKPIKIPEEVKVDITDSILKLKGPKGEAEYQIPAGIKIEKNEENIRVLSSRKRKEDRVKFGLVRATINNLKKGVFKGFKKELELFGVGYTATLEGEDLVLTLGFSHPIKISKPKDIEIDIKKNILTISGINREKVGQFAAHIHDLRRAEPYKGKGFKYTDEVIRRKVGKAALKTETEAKA